MTFTPFALPAIVGLVTKAGMFAYTRWSKVRNAQTRVYLALLVNMALYNLIEIALFVNHRDGVITPLRESVVKLLVSAIYSSAAIFLHLALVTALKGRDGQENVSRRGMVLLYVPTLVSLVMFWCTSLLVVGYVPMSYTYTRVPGPLYFLFEIYFAGYLSAALALLLYGAYRQTSAFRRTQNKLLLVGCVPMVALAVAIIVLQRMGFRGFNATATITVTITLFLAFAAYATHQHRLFDIAFFVPWSKARREKTAFYEGIKAAIDEIANLGSIGEIVQRVSDTLRCPIALVSGPTSSFAMVGDAYSIARFPISELRKLDQLTVADEIAETVPATYELMKRYQVAAIVPFHPHSEAAASWMLLGEAFSEHVYSPIDFKMVEILFARLADRFLDTQLLSRYQADNGRWLRVYNPARPSARLDGSVAGPKEAENEQPQPTRAQ